jgi:hypothetical protein
MHESMGIHFQMRRFRSLQRLLTRFNLRTDLRISDVLFAPLQWSMDEIRPLHSRDQSPTVTAYKTALVQRVVDRAFQEGPDEVFGDERGNRVNERR